MLSMDEVKSMSIDLFGALTKMGHGALVADLTAGMAARVGTAHQRRWTCEDRWLVVYTTTRVEGGPNDGKFIAQLFKPIRPKGRGSRSAPPTAWTEVRRVQRNQRKAAKAQALRWYRAHSPRWAERNPEEVNS